MSDYATHWRRMVGDGCIYNGPCVVKAIVLFPDADTDYTDIYDGRDASSGEKFCRIEAATQTTRTINLGAGVRFGRGIYIDGEDTAVETTVAFDLLDEPVE